MISAKPSAPVKWPGLLPLLVSVSACTTIAPAVAPCPPPLGTTGYQCFSRPEDAPSGMARLYVFRPILSGRQAADNPVLIVDDSYEIALGLSSYTPFDLPLGTHRFKLIPGQSDSDIWKLEGQFEVETVGRYYLAIWDARIAESTGDPSPRASDPSSDAVLGVVGVAAAAVLLTRGFLIVPAPAGRGATRFTKSARYELVNEQEALESLRECKLALPRKLEVKNPPRESQ